MKSQIDEAAAVSWAPNEPQTIAATDDLHISPSVRTESPTERRRGSGRLWSMASCKFAPITVGSRDGIKPLCVKRPDAFAPPA